MKTIFKEMEFSNEDENHFQKKTLLPNGKSVFTYWVC